MNITEGNWKGFTLQNSNYHKIILTGFDRLSDIEFIVYLSKLQEIQDELINTISSTDNSKLEYFLYLFELGIVFAKSSDDLVKKVSYAKKILKKLLQSCHKNISDQIIEMLLYCTLNFCGDCWNEKLIDYAEELCKITKNDLTDIDDDYVKVIKNCRYKLIDKITEHIRHKMENDVTNNEYYANELMDCLLILKNFQID